MGLMTIFLTMLVIFYLACWIIDPEKCDICHTSFKRKIYIVKYDEKTLHLCLRCKRQYEKKSPKQHADNFIKTDRSSERLTLRLSGVPVTKFLKKIEQPRGGFITRKDMLREQLDDGRVLYDSENVHPSLIGMAVDYLTRYMLFGDKESSFKISLIGATLVHETHRAERLLESIDRLNSESVIAALKLSGYDVAYRAGRIHYRNMDSIEPDAETIENVIIMVNRSVLFFKRERVIDAGMTFEGAYTKNVSSGDADYLTEDTLWDMKVSKAAPNKDQTIQLVIYYLLMKESVKYKDSKVEKIGIFNPRENLSYTYELKNLDPEILENIYSLINN